jgi:hypothetical protein
MIVDPAGFVIEDMRANYKYNREGQNPVLVVVPNLLCYQKNDSCSKNKQRHKAVVVPPIAVP